MGKLTGGSALTLCSVCKGPFHPDTGCVLGNRTRLCGPCERGRVAWLKKHLSRKSGGVRFYDHASTVKTDDPSVLSG